MLVKNSENILPITPISYIEEAYPAIEFGTCCTIRSSGAVKG